MTEPTKEAGERVLDWLNQLVSISGDFPLDDVRLCANRAVAMSAASVDDEMVERVAIECHHASCANVPQSRPDYRREWYPWDNLPDSAKNAWRAIAKAALAAVKLEGVGEP